MMEKTSYMIMNRLLIILCVLFISAGSFAAELTPEMYTYAKKVAAEGKISRKAVVRWLKRVRLDMDVVDLMDRQAEKKEWKDYKPYFINDTKIKKGVHFIRRYPKTLAKAQRIYGVDKYVVAAILGVETDFGTYDLQHRAMDALFTLAFYYPRRADYFKDELQALMIYAYRNRLDPFNLKSSYAGAVGMPQFMPSNIMKFGKEFSGDGRINIFKSGADSIGSIANYLEKNGWDRGEPIAVLANVEGDAWTKYLDKGLKPQFDLADMKKDGVEPSLPVKMNRKAALIKLEAEDGPEYWIVFNNFYVISRYNPSAKYALAVTILSKHLELHSRRR